MTNKKNKLMAAISALVAVVLVVFAFNQNQPKPENQASLEKAKQTVSEQGAESSTDTQSEAQTVANAWQWETISSPSEEMNDEMSESSNEQARPFTKQSVYDALQAVKIDESGHIVLDHTALISLDEALERIYGKLDENNLTQLKSLIEEHLPGIAGQQTAQLVEDYTNFLVAKDEFSRVYEQIDPQEVQSLETLTRDEGLYEELQALREVYLGKEATDQLFRVSDANAKLMFETLKVGADQSLTAEERTQRLAAAQEEHARQTIDIPNWGDRYDSFLTAKQTILDASISDSEKQNQLSSLLNDHFNEHEQSLIEHLALDIL